MKSSVKKIAIAVVAAVATVASAASMRIYSVEDVNKAVTELLAPFQNEKTTAFLKFTDLRVNEQRVEKFRLTAAILKIGTNNILELGLPEVTYTNDGAGHAGLALEALIKLDLVKAFSQKYINEAGPELSQLIVEMSKGFVSEFGEAATIDTAVDEMVKDEAGDLVSVKVHFTANIDFAKLPKNVASKDVFFKAVRFNLNVSRTQAGLRAEVDLNPASEGFNEDSRGFKEVVDALLNQDPKTLDEIRSLISSLNNAGDWLVEKKADEEPKP